MTDPREAVYAPADSGRCSNPSQFEFFRCLKCGYSGDIATAEIQQHRAQCALAHQTVQEIGLVDRLRASVRRLPAALQRLVDDEPPAEIFDPTLQRPAVDEIADGDRIEVEILPAGVAALSALAGQAYEQGRLGQKRDQLLASLICAARKLADERVHVRHTIDRGSVYYCGECQADIEADPLRNAHEHHRNCKTGLVFVLLAELARLPRESVENPGAHCCDACGLTDGAWVSETMSWLRARSLGLALNQLPKSISDDLCEIRTHLCPEELAKMGGAA